MGMKFMKILKKVEIEAELEKLKGWKLENNKIVKKFTFENFREAMGFILRISYEAENRCHHPEILNCFNRIEISLQTHDAGAKVTRKDLELAHAIDALN